MYSYVYDYVEEILDRGITDYDNIWLELLEKYGVCASGVLLCEILDYFKR